jgi:octaprenyl-diphosphate synthase
MLRTRPPKLSDVQRPIGKQLEHVVGELRRIVLSDFPAIGDVNEHLFWARGKLFRPTLLLLSNQIGGKPHPRAVTLAALVELVHLATRVHDDAVDHSVLRRGMPTVNALWNHQTAIIMGDFLYSRSVTELAALGRVDLIEILARAANEMSVGEMRQLLSCDVLEFSEADYDRLIASKTASLMSAACELGAAAGASTYRETLARFGHALGMAFQIVDDLLDYTESADVTGKPSGQDLREHKMTLPLIHALGVMTDLERAEVQRFFADPEPGAERIERLIRLVRAKGGLEYARTRAEHYAEQAAAAALELPVSAASESLREAVAYVQERRS